MINNTKLDRFDLIMNPALGAVTLSSFAKGYFKNKDALPFILLFFVIPLVFQEDIRKTVISSRNFKGMISKLLKYNKNKVVLIHKNIKDLRYLTFKSFLISVSLNFININYKEGVATKSGDFIIPDGYKNNLLNEFVDAAFKLGTFFSKTPIRFIFQHFNVEA